MSQYPIPIVHQSNKARSYNEYNKEKCR